MLYRLFIVLFYTSNHLQLHSSPLSPPLALCHFSFTALLHRLTFYRNHPVVITAWLFILILPSVLSFYFYISTAFLSVFYCNSLIAINTSFLFLISLCLLTYTLHSSTGSSFITTFWLLLLPGSPFWPCLSFQPLIQLFSALLPQPSVFSGASILRNHLSSGSYWILSYLTPFSTSSLPHLNYPEIPVSSFHSHLPHWLIFYANYPVSFFLTLPVACPLLSSSVYLFQTHSPMGRLLLDFFASLHSFSLFPLSVISVHHSSRLILP